MTVQLTQSDPDAEVHVWMPVHRAHRRRAAPVAAPFSPAEQLFYRRQELGHANLDRLASHDESLWARIHADRDATIVPHRFAALA